MSRRSILWAAGLAVVLSGCADNGTQPEPGADLGAPVTGTVTVLVASSLTDVADGIAAELERTHDDLTVRVSSGGSAALVHQVLAGAPADVLVTADRASLRPALDAGAVLDPVPVAVNTPALVVPADNPGDVHHLADLERTDLRVALCAPTVPCGSVAREVLDRAGVDAAVDTEESGVRSVLAKVRLGEADAGIVYATDALAAGADVRTLDLGIDPPPSTVYLAAQVVDGPHPAAGAVVLEALRSRTSRDLLTAAGFGLP